LKRSKLYCSIALLGGLMFCGGLIFIQPDRTFSENENRILKEKPEFSFESVRNGSYQNELTEYLSDQFPGRDRWMEFGTKLKLMTGRKDIGETYIGKEHYYFEKVTNQDINWERYKNNLIKIDGLAKKFPDVKCKTMLVPSSGTVLSDKLPAFAEIYDVEKMYEVEKEILNSSDSINLLPIMKEHRKEEIYYKTDHHWTTKGAYLGYCTLMGEERANKQYQTQVGSNSFYGTLFSRTMDSTARPDTVELPKVTSAVKVSINGEPSKIYDLDKLSKKDKYQVFFGGNHGRVDITGGKGKGTLLVLKDSFANSMIPFMVDDYEKIVMIDLRFYAGSVQSLMNAEQFDEMLVLYERNNFATDTNIAKLSL